MKPIFNPDDFSKQYASVTYSSNNFLGSNSFVDIFVSSINGITEQILGYISTLRGDAQAQIDSKRDKADNTFNGPIYNLKLSTETYVDTSVVNMKNSILNGAGPAYDTLIELQNELIDNDTQINNLLGQIATKAPINNPTFTGTVNGITKAMVGLSNVNNTSDASKPISTVTQNALNLKANINNPTFTGTVNGITQAMVGLSNADNTSDVNKPISTATQTALNLKANLLDPVFSNNITVNNNATFNKGITITETSPNIGESLRSATRNSQLNFIGGTNAGNYNLITADNDNVIFYHNGSKDTGALNIVNWSDGSNGMKLTKQLRKVYNNFEVTNGSFVGSPIFRPTGNSAFGLGNNIYNTTYSFNLANNFKWNCERNRQ